MITKVGFTLLTESLFGAVLDTVFFADVRAEAFCGMAVPYQYVVLHRVYIVLTVVARRHERGRTDVRINEKVAGQLITFN